jgi:hypothetical protein
MKNMLLFFFLFSSVLSMAQGQTKNPLENVVITSEKDKTQVRTNENGELLINVSPKDVLKFKANGFVRYRDFGAMGDGKKDDTDVQNRNANILTGHKVYQTIGSAGVTVSMGTYDLSLNRALNVTFVNFRQTNDINDSKYWGILGSNYCKNLVFDSCTLSRFDAHMGVANATIRNSTLGHQGINAIGSGTFTVENSTIYARNLINLRSDYGSTWQGEFFFRNCVFVPAGGRMASASLIGGSYSGQHDFGYTCYMPERIIIENLRIDDSNHPMDYQGPAVFADFNPKMTDDSYVEKFPYVRTREVILRNVTIASGKTLRLSDNPFMFKDVKVNSDH